MLLFNFICLFYLMVLVSSHTISKSIDNDYKVDDTIDNLYNFEYTTEHSLKYDKLHHKYRSAEKAKSPTAKLKGTAKKEKTTLVITLPVMNPTKQGGKLSTHMRGMWKKLKSKLSKTKTRTQSRKRRVFRRLKANSSNDTDLAIKARHESDYDRKDRVIKKPRKEKKKFAQEKRKREVQITENVFIERVTEINKRSLCTKTMSITPFKILKNQSIIFKTTPLQAKGLTDISRLNTQLQELNTMYEDTNKKTVYTPSRDTKTTLYPKVKFSEEGFDYSGTAAIEVLLNEIKARAMQMISEQNPSVTDMITNSVTETTFESDPIMNHLEGKSGLITTLIAITSLNEDLTNKNTRRSPEFHNPNETVVISDIDMTHNIAARSIIGDAYTIANCIEDKLQYELKDLYNKIKSKLLTELPNEARKETKQLADKVKKLTTPKTTKPTKAMKAPNLMTKTMTLRQHRGTDNLEMKMHKTTTKNPPENERRTIPTLEDDYEMLSVFEQLLAKTHEDNVMKMLTMPTTVFTKHKSMKGKFRLSKRNPETLADLTLKETIRRQNDGEGIPEEMDYFSQSKPDSSPSPNEYESYDDVTRQQVSSIGDTSFDGLSNKLSYKEYVNGYKHYLNFTRDNDDDQKFSALIRYQAHRHHSVDDIGKYILNKIPEVPMIRSKRFFNDFDSEDQDVSTRSDDSWFKKHFYLFLDTAPPRKFHTSQIVSLKSPDNEPDEVSNSEAYPEKKNRNTFELEEDVQTIENPNYEKDNINLDSLMKTLEHNKFSPSWMTHRASTKPINTNYTIPEENSQGLIAFAHQNIIGKLFGNKGRRAPKSNKKKMSDEDPNELIEKMLDQDFGRMKRNLQENSKYFNHNYEQQKEEFESRKSTVPTNLFDQASLTTNKQPKHKNYGYVDVNLIPKPTAFVKLKDQTTGKIKKFFSKLKFRKIKKGESKPKQHKRDIHRAPRFNPFHLKFKKIRDMFKNDEGNLGKMATLSGYDNDLQILSSKIDAFKIYKYGKAMSVEEMKKQIPNITGYIFPEGNFEERILQEASEKNANDVKIDKYSDFNFDKPVYDTKLEKPVVETKLDKPYSEKKIVKPLEETKLRKPLEKVSYDSKDEKQLSNPYDKPTLWDKPLKFYKLDKFTVTVLKPTWDTNMEKETTENLGKPETPVLWDSTDTLDNFSTPTQFGKPIPWDKSADVTTNWDSNSFEDTWANEIYAKLGNGSTKSESVKADPIDDQKIVIQTDKEKKKKSKHVFQQKRLKTATPNRKTKLLNRISVNPITIAEIINKVDNLRKDVLALKDITMDSVVDKKTTPNKYVGYNLSPKIQKFYLIPSYFHNSTLKLSPRARKSRLFSNLPQRSVDNALLVLKQDKVGNNEAFFENKQVKAKTKDSSKIYPDHFYDLMNWHNDILNLDVITPSGMPWEDILKTIHDKELTKSNLHQLQEDLRQMRQFIDEASEVKEKKAYTERQQGKTVTNKGTTRSAAEDKLIDFLNAQTSKGKSEKKDKKFFLEPSLIPENIFKAADIVNDINKIYLKSFKALPLNITEMYELANKFRGPPKEDKAEALKVPLPVAVDTTLLSYNDAVDAMTEISKITETSNVKKHSRHLGTTASSAETKTTTVKSKTNTPPVQYFTTPVPMKTIEFDRFLKEHMLDVHTVTLPMSDSSKYDETWFTKNGVFSKLTSTHSKGVKNKTKSNNIAIANTTPFLMTELNDTTSTEPYKTVRQMKVSSKFSFNAEDEMQYLDLLENSINEDYEFDNETAKRKKRDEDLKAPYKIKETRKVAFNPDYQLQYLDGLENGLSDDFDFYNETEERKKRDDESVDWSDYFRPSYPAKCDKQEIKDENKEVRKKTVTEPKSGLNDLDITFINMDDNAIRVLNNKQTSEPELSELEQDFNKKKDKTSKQVRTTIKNKQLTSAKMKDINDDANDLYLKTMHNGLLYYTKDYSPTVKTEPIKFSHAFDIDDKTTEGITTKIKTTLPSYIPTEVTNKQLPEFKPTEVTNKKLPEFKPTEVTNKKLSEFKPTEVTNKKLSEFKPTEVTKKKLSEFNNPKRILISSNSLKYDVIYYDPVTKLTYGTVTVEPSTKSYYPYEKNWKERSYNTKSTMSLSTKQMDRTPLFYDLKDQSEKMPRTSRSRFNFFPILKEKLKLRARNVTTNLLTKMDTNKPVRRSKVTNTTQAYTSETIAEVSDEVRDDRLMNDDNLILDSDGNELKDEIMENKPPYIPSDAIASEEPNGTNTVENADCIEPDNEFAENDPQVKPSKEIEIPALIKDMPERAEPLHKKITNFKPLNNTIQPFITQKLLSNEKDDKTTVGIHKSFKINTTRIIKGTRFGKRDVLSQNTFTAKDVAALEVIVDLMKNPSYLEDKDTFSYDSMMQQRRTNTIKLQPNTNSIIVHIAIPYAVETGKKRAADSLKVRRVFMAKMNTPVDLEYQVQSFEDVTEVTKAEQNLSPGMYLIVENSNMSKGNFVLKPINSNVVVREVGATQPMKIEADVIPTLAQKVDTTSPKILGRVTLSKDFIAAVNKELIDIYENQVHKTTVHSIRVRKTEEENTKKVKRKINWDKIKKFFGHDKVCTCHCKSNSTLCRACAASDAVMSDLIFEFDNLARFMHDHCTEIQTYFWMNPSGGRKLRDSVHKIDTALYDYYKRVKGKCRGKTCKTFSTYIDKRTPVNLKPVDRLTNYTKEELLDDIESLAGNIENATRLNITPNKALKYKCTDFINAFRNCLTSKSLRKRSEFNPVKKKEVKSVYSLDNINVNLICKPDSRTQFKDYAVSPPGCITQSAISYITEPTTSTIEIYDDDEIKQKRKKNKLKHLLSRIKNKKSSSITTPYPKDVINKILTSHRKREAKLSQREAPLIADTGGTFWYDYLNKGNRVNYKDSVKPNIEKQSNQAIDSSPMTTAVKIYPFTPKEKVKNSKQNTIYLTVTSGAQRHVQRHNQENTLKPELLSYNMNELFKLFDQLPDVEEVRHLSTEAIKLKKEKTKKHKIKTTTTKYTETQKAKTKKIKTPKTTVERKLLKHKPHKSVVPNNFVEETKITQTITTYEDLPQDSDSEDKQQLESKEINHKSIIKKLKSVNSDILKSIGNNVKFLAKKTTAATSSDGLRLIRTAFNTTVSKRDFINVNSEMTTVSNPTIFIIDVTAGLDKNASQDPDATDLEDTDRKFVIDEMSHEKVRNLLLSILKYENESINNEIKRLATFDEAKSEDDMDDLTFTDQHVTPSRKRKIKIDKLDVEGASGDYCIFDKLKHLDLEKPVPAKIDEGKSKKEKGQKGSLNQLISQFKVFVLPDPKKAGHKEVKLRFLRDKMLNSSKSLDKEGASSNPIMVKGHPANLLPILENKNFIKQPKFTTQQTTEIQKPKASVIETSRDNSPTTTSETVLSIETYRNTVMLNNTENAKKKVPGKKAYDSTTASSQICDIHATLQHVLIMRKTLPKKQFGDYVKRLKCHKYKRTPKYFLVELPRRRRQFRRNFDTNVRYDMGLITPRNAIKWDWIRNKRSLLNFDYNNNGTEVVDDNGTVNQECNDSVDDIKDNYGVESLSDVNIIENESGTDFGDDFFEKYFKDDDDVYRTRKWKRRKRTAVDMKELVSGLRNLPPLRPQLNEIYAMAGDNILIECLPKARYSLRIDQDVTWKTDRSAMLKYDNVIVSGLTVFVRRVEPRNVGNYSCVKGATVHRNVRLTVITVPMFNVVFIPMYSSKEQCSYDDLKALQHLGPVMSQLTCSCKDHKSIVIEEPICLRDEEDETKLRATAVLTACPPPDVRCSAQCKRDLQCSLALLCATNAHALSSVRVLISKDGENKSLTPSYKRSRKAIVTHTLRKKDLTGHVEYHRLAASMNPGNVDIVVVCPKGHFLLPALKICLVCPADTYSGEGENACFTCALGSAAEPGADRCRLSIAKMRTRRYDWCWVPGYALFAGAALAALAGVCVCVVCARVTSRGACRPPVVVGRVDSLWTWGRRAPAATLPKNCSSTIQTKSPRRPMSPSRVLLARLFRGSQTSSRATDSQENKFESWKEKKKPPPLPPIDFE